MCCAGARQPAICVGGVQPCGADSDLSYRGLGHSMVIPSFIFIFEGSCPMCLRSSTDWYSGIILRNAAIDRLLYHIDLLLTYTLEAPLALMVKQPEKRLNSG